MPMLSGSQLIATFAASRLHHDNKAAMLKRRFEAKNYPLNQRQYCNIFLTSNSQRTLVMNSYKHILVAIDIYGDYQSVLNRAAAIANDSTRISLIYVIEPVYYTEIYDGGMIVDLHNKAREKAKESLANICSEYSVSLDNTCIEDGHPGSKIHAAAEEKQVDLIIIGSHGKRGLQLLLGSTANAVLHGAKCDVLAVRIDDNS